MTTAPIVQRAPMHAALLEGAVSARHVVDLVKRFEQHIGEGAAGRSSILIGDFIEKGQTGRDRHRDQGGDPVYLVLTPLAASTGTPRGVAPPSWRTFWNVPGVLVTQWLLAHRFERSSSTAQPAAADWLQLVMMNVEPAAEDEFNAWYEDEHVARIAAVAPEFVRVDRLVCDGGSPRHFALWQLRDRKAPERDPWLSASETPWTTRIRGFMRDRRRMLLVPLQRGASPD